MAVFLLVGISFQMAFGLDEQVGKPESPGDGRNVLQTALSERSALLTGVYTAQGKRTAKKAGADDSQSPELSGDIIVNCAFEYPRGFIRWEREEPQLFIEKKGGGEVSTVRQISYKFIKTTHKCYVLDSRGGVDVTNIVVIH